MPTIYNIIRILKKYKLEKHEIIFIVAHTVIIDHGFHIKLKENNTSSNSDPCDDKNLNYNNSIYLEQDGALSLKIFPANWRIQDISSQAYSVNYVSPFEKIESYLGPKEISLKALIVASKLVFHLSETNSPEKLNSFEIPLNSNTLSNLSLDQDDNILKPNEITPLDTLYRILFEKIHPILTSNFELPDPHVKSSSRAPDSIHSVINPEKMFFPKPKISTLDGESELIGPNHPIFRGRIQSQIRRNLPRIDFEPFDPLGINPDSDNDTIPNFSFNPQPFL